MTTYEEFLYIINRLPPNIQEILWQIWRSGRSLSPGELLRLLSLLLGSARPEVAALIQRAIILLGRLGRIAPGVAGAALELHAAGEGASVVAGGSGAGGGAAAGTAATGTAALIASILIALIAVAIAAYKITTEILKELKFPDIGPLCDCSGGGCSFDGGVRNLDEWGIGSKTAVQNAVDAAQADCESTCSCDAGKCPPGYICKPSATIISIDPKYRVFWTTAFISYTCVCRCMAVLPIGIPVGDEFWNEHDWDELSDIQKEMWEILGWDEDMWDEPDEHDPPASQSKTWEELSEKERKAASALGYTEETWNESD